MRSAEAVASDGAMSRPGTGGCLASTFYIKHSAMLSPLLCGIAAYRLYGSPLQGGAFALLALSLMTLVWVLVSARRSEDGPSRLSTALSHIVTALGGFFLFVSFALP